MPATTLWATPMRSGHRGRAIATMIAINPTTSSHADREIGQRLGAVQHVFGGDKAGAPEHDKNRRRRARGKVFKVFFHLRA